MKNKKCPCKKHCWDYKSGDCDNCDIGREINRLHRKNRPFAKEGENV